MPRFYYLLFFILCLTNTSRAQKSIALSAGNYGTIRTVEKKMQRIGFAMLGDTVQENRLKGARETVKQLVEALKTENSFQFAFDSLPYIAKCYPEDSSFRIFTFQVMLDNYTYVHYGAIQMNRSKLKLIPFRDFSDTFPITPQKMLTNKNWLGAIYYRCFTKSVRGKPMYFLLGYDENDALSVKKYIEPMTIVGDSAAKFGMPVFELNRVVNMAVKPALDPKTMKPLPPVKSQVISKILHRFVLEYRKGGTATISYEPEKNRILFEHLATTDNKSHDVGYMKVPDGTYEGLVWENEKWVWKETLTVAEKDDNRRIRPVPKSDKGLFD